MPKFPAKNFFGGHMRNSLPTLMLGRFSNKIEKKRLYKAALAVTLLLLIINGWQFLGLNSNKIVKADSQRKARGKSSKAAHINPKDASAPLIAAVVPNGIVMKPQGSATLQVQVTDSDGNPLNNQSVIFLAPDEGAGGTFQDAQPAGAPFIAATTDSKGMASAVFVSNQAEGVFLVDAVVEGMDSEITFAITNSAAPANPMLTPDEARVVIKQQALSVPGQENITIVEDENIKLHGPVFLPAGTIVQPKFFSSVYGDAASNSMPFTTDKMYWFFWVDHVPSSLYSHPTDFIFLDASKSKPDYQQDALVTSQGWWPVITLPGANSAIDLLPPTQSDSALLVDADAASTAAPPAKKNVIKPADVNPTDTCVVIIVGSKETDLAADAINLKNYFTNNLNIPEDQIFGLKTTDRFLGGKQVQVNNINDLSVALNQAKNSKFKKVYLCIISHGFAPGDGIIPGDGAFQINNNDGSVGAFSYSGIANFFQGDSQELNIILQPCNSGAAIPAFQKAGIKGTIVTSANPLGFCQGKTRVLRKTKVGDIEFVIPGFVGTYFIDTLIATLNKAGGDLQMAGQALKNFGSDVVTDPKPEVTSLSPTGPALSATLSTVLIPLQTSPDMATATILRPNGIDPSESVTVHVKIANSQFAALDEMGTQEDNFTLKPGEMQRDIPIFGFREGETSFSEQGNDATGKIFLAAGNIVVGGGFELSQNDLTLFVGQKFPITLSRYGVKLQFSHQEIVDIAGGAENGKTIATATTQDGVSVADIFKPKEVSRSITITGVMEGTTKFFFRDSVNSNKEVILNVKVINKCLNGNVSFDTQFAVKMDPAGHDRFIGLRQANLTLAAADGDLSITGNKSQTVAAMGAFDSSSCSSAEATGSGTIAGFPGVSCAYENVTISTSTASGRADGISPQATTITITGDYVLGLHGELPTGRPIDYSFTGQATISNPAPGDFALAIEPIADTVSAGDTISFAINVLGINNFAQSINLNVNSMSGNITPTLTTKSVMPNGNAAVMIATTAMTPADIYTITVTGSAGQTVHTATASVIVDVLPVDQPTPDFFFTIAPDANTVQAGSSTSFTISAQGLNGFTDAVNLSATAPDSSITTNFAPASIAPGNSATLTVNTTTQTAPATYPIAIIGSAGQLTHMQTVMVTVTPPPMPDFSLSLSPLTINRGQQGDIAAMIARTGGFTGNVTVSAPDAAMLKSLKIKITPPSQATTADSLSFRIKIKKSAAAGTQSLTFTGTDDSGNTHTATLALTIQ